MTPLNYGEGDRSRGRCVQHRLTKQTYFVSRLSVAPTFTHQNAHQCLPDPYRIPTAPLPHPYRTPTGSLPDPYRIPGGSLPDQNTAYLRVYLRV
jgi:hypothetical protein